MPRTRATCSYDSMNRAAKVAKANGMTVEIKPDGTIYLHPVSQDVQQVSSGKDYRL